MGSRAVPFTIERAENDLDLATLLAQKETELVQCVATHLDPLGAQLLGLDIVQGPFQVSVDVELGVRFEIQPRAFHVWDKGIEEPARSGRPEEAVLPPRVGFDGSLLCEKGVSGAFVLLPVYCPWRILR